MVVDLGERGPLFVTLWKPQEYFASPAAHRQPQPNRDSGVLPSFDYATQLAYWLFDGYPPTEEETRNIERLEASAHIPLNQVPFLMGFRDLSDPTSYQELDPSNLSDFYGDDVVLLRATIETTRDAVTFGNLARYIPWITEFKGRLRPEAEHRSALSSYLYRPGAG
ncbi:MAG: hypothetical protein IT535_09005 [Bauldia sp.]|nr:hypothetical protein [Bauldia sp.]